MQANTEGWINEASVAILALLIERKIGKRWENSQTVGKLIWNAI